MNEFNANGHGDDGDLYILEEGDISGASLHGKKPSELTVAKLKRWLSCRGTPLSGKKPELVERYYCFCKTAACSLHPQWRAQLQMYMFTSYQYFLCRVECYIKFGWDHLLVDPDKGLNTRKKLLNMAGERMESEPSGLSQLTTLLESLPNTTDSQWTESLVDIPQISFNAIFKFSVERKVPRKKVNYLENLADFRAHMSLQEDSSKESAEELYMEAEYTRTLDKAYRFFHDGHVQDLKFHPMPHLENGVCVVSRVLASMKKVFYHLNLARHSVYRDGSCLYHSIAHQAGFIAKSSCGDKLVSNHLRQVAHKTMNEHPCVHLEEGLSVVQWLEKKERVMDPTEWGGDMEVRLLAIALHRDIIVITDNSSDGSYARRFPCQPPPLPKMKGGIFIPIKCKELCVQWTMTPTPLVIIFNGVNHYDSTISLSM
ncbi:uncharacterized protein [Dysidea avara]|uniref:uncharacterized protein n=1 Tax=Dysidea avara TaxID=196820 RepID=UPI003330D3D5